MVVLLALATFAAACGRLDYKTGAEVFQGECARCHKLNGTGGSKGPDLSRIFQKRKEPYIRHYTMDPRSIKADGTMPPARISERELDLLIAYLKSEQHQP